MISLMRVLWDQGVNWSSDMQTSLPSYNLRESVTTWKEQNKN